MTLSRDELGAALRAALTEIAPDCDVEALAANAPMRETIDLDSIDVLRLAERIEKRTGIAIPERDLGKLDTLQGWLDYLSGEQ